MSWPRGRWRCSRRLFSHRARGCGPAPCRGIRPQRFGAGRRCGLLAGADAALYLGGSSTRDSAGVARTWGPTGSPYRPLSLSLSAGLDLRYRLAPRLAAVAQPTATYFLAALSRPETGLTPRRLVGVGVLVGVAYELW